MKARRMGTCAAMGLIVLLGTMTAFSQDKPAPGSKDKPTTGSKDTPPGGAPAQPDEAEMAKAMEAYMKLAAPGEQHKLLDPFIGKWKTATKIFMGGPGSPAMESVGTCENKWVLGGRFVYTEQKGTMMGQPFEGMGLTGFDKPRNMFVSMWADNQGTHLLTMKGMADPSGKTFTYYGEMDEASMNVYGRMVKYVTRVIDKDKHVFEITDLHAGDNYKVVEITYTRQ